MASRYDPKSPDTEAQVMLMAYKRRLRAAETRNRLDEDSDDGPRNRNAVSTFFARLARWLKEPA